MVARLLTAARSRIAPEAEGEYLATVGALSVRLAGRGQHLWLFRRRSGVGEFLEFSEGKDDASHRRAGPADAVEGELEARLLALATYDETRHECWDEVPLHST